MNSLEALEHLYNNDINMVIATYPPIYTYNGLSRQEMKETVEKDLKVLNLLKEKKVNLNYVSSMLDFYDRTIELVREYNTFADYEQLTEEEMQLIVGWLKEE